MMDHQLGHSGGVGSMTRAELGGVKEAVSVLDAKGRWHLKGGRIWARGGEGKKHPKWRHCRSKGP